MAHKRLRDGWIPVGHKEEKIAVIGMVMIMIPEDEIPTIEHLSKEKIKKNKRKKKVKNHYYLREPKLLDF